jgi:hypothetical protein
MNKLHEVSDRRLVICDDCVCGAEVCARTEPRETPPEHVAALILDHAPTPSDAESEAA